MSTERKRNHMIWIGPLLGVAGVLSYFMVFARFAALRDFPWINLPLVVLAAAVSGIGVWRAYGRSQIFRGKVLSLLGFAVSLFFAGLFILYIFSVSYSLPTASEATLQLTRAPDFALTAMDGETVRLSDFRGRKVALIFYRGHW